MATERTAVHATVHIREKTARKVSNKSKLCILVLVNDPVIDKNLTFIHLRR